MYIWNYNKDSLIIKVQVNVFLYTWMMIFFVHINITLSFGKKKIIIMKYKST